MEALVAHEDGRMDKRMLKLIRMAASYAVACPFCVDMNSYEHRKYGISEEEAQTLNKAYQSFAEKKRDAQRRIKENTVGATTTTQPYAGRTMTQANLERYAKDKGLSVEEARKQVELQGVRVQ